MPFNQDGKVCNIVLVTAELDLRGLAGMVDLCQFNILGPLESNFAPFDSIESASLAQSG